MPYCLLSEQRSETVAALPKAEGPLFSRLEGHECPILGGNRTTREGLIVIGAEAFHSRLVKAIFVLPVLALLLGCEQPEPAISDEEFAAFRDSHPGMIQTCLDEVRFGGFIEWRPDDPDCYEMLPAKRWSGLWEHGWEWTNFCPDPADTCDWMAKRGIWLVFADNVELDDNLPDGIHRIEFVGRRTKVPGELATPLAMST